MSQNGDNKPVTITLPLHGPQVGTFYLVNGCWIHQKYGPNPARATGVLILTEAIKP